MDKDNYNVSWQTHGEHIQGALEEMLSSKEFTDVTLISDDKKQVRAHRNILSACSPVFRSILQIETLNNQPVIYLKGINYSDLESILQFIYLGHATILKDGMANFLEAAKSLQIKELSGEIDVEDSGKQAETKQKKTIPEPKETKCRSQEEDELAKNKNIDQPSEATINDVEEKTEIMDPAPETTNFDCNDCEFQAKSGNLLMQHVKSKHHKKFACNLCDFKSRAQRELKVHIENVHMGVRYQCDQCGKEFKSQQLLREHSLLKHGDVTYPCSQCDYRSTSRRNLKLHLQSKHEGILKYTCNVSVDCNYQTFSLQVLRQHKKSH